MSRGLYVGPAEDFMMFREGEVVTAFHIVTGVFARPMFIQHGSKNLGGSR
jgi:hypothetical protein